MFKKAWFALAFAGVVSVGHVVANEVVPTSDISEQKTEVTEVIETVEVPVVLNDGF